MATLLSSHHGLISQKGSTCADAFDWKSSKAASESLSKQPKMCDFRQSHEIPQLLKRNIPKMSVIMKSYSRCLYGMEVRRSSLQQTSATYAMISCSCL